MTCTNPIRIKDPAKALPTPGGFLVPCRKCIACRVQKSNEWSNRLIQEMSYFQSAVFLTLTYDDLHIPENGSLRKSDLQNFFKRLRKNVPDHPFKYFASGEYGGVTGRPHYHIILLGYSGFDPVFHHVRPIKGSMLATCDEWPNGNVYLGSVTRDSCRYTVDYALKAQYDKDYSIPKDLQAPFQLQSQGIGLRWAQDHEDQLKSDLGMRINGRMSGLPSYYVDKLQVSRQARSDKSKELEAQRDMKFLSQGVHWMDIPDHIKAINYQFDLELKGLRALKENKKNNLKSS